MIYSPPTPETALTMMENCRSQIVAAVVGRRGTGLSIESLADEARSKVFEALVGGKYAGRGPVCSWMAVVARNYVKDLQRSYGRRLRREVPVEPDTLQRSPELSVAGSTDLDDPAGSVSAQADFANLIAGELRARLKKSSFEILQLRHIDELSVDEICDRLDLTKAAYEKRLSRANSRARHEIARICEERGLT